MFSSRCFMVSGLMFKSLPFIVHFCEWSKIGVQFHYFPLDIPLLNFKKICVAYLFIIILDVLHRL